MFLFPLVYIIVFLKTIKEFCKANASGLMLFIVIAMPIYINSLSIIHMYGYGDLIGSLQLFKELAVLIALIIVIWQLKKLPIITNLDWLILIFLGYSFIFVLVPVGSYNFLTRLLAFKSLSFFCILYIVGRLINVKYIVLSKYFKLVGIMTIIAAIVALFEFFSNEHLHVNTGFTEFLIDFFDGESSGNYGLIWTFETETGQKRFGSIFGGPLELGASMLLALSFCLAFYTNKTKGLVLTKFGKIYLLATLICIILALSRASLLGFFIIIILYAIITNNKLILKVIYITITIASLYFIYFLSQTDIYQFIVDSITFNNASSLGHLLEWIDGFDAMIKNPLGLGLGESGRISMGTKDNTGGENQFIITGVQMGLPMLIVYTVIHIKLIKKSYNHIWSNNGKIKRIAMTIFLFKIGIIIPMFTSNTEAFVYISYFTWFLSGVFMNLISHHEIQKNSQ